MGGWTRLLFSPHHEKRMNGENRNWLSELESSTGFGSECVASTAQEGSQTQHKSMPRRTALGMCLGHRGDSVLGRAQAMKLIGWYFIMKAP